MHRHQTEQAAVGRQRGESPEVNSCPSSADDLKTLSDSFLPLPVTFREIELMQIYFADLIAAILLDTP